MTSRRRAWNPKRPGSRHFTGEAADIRSASLSPAELHARIRAAWERGDLPELGGLGVYDTHVHVDVRRGRRLAEWDERTD